MVSYRIVLYYFGLGLHVFIFNSMIVLKINFGIILHPIFIYEFNKGEFWKFLLMICLVIWKHWQMS